MNSANLFDLSHETLTLRLAELKATEPSRRQRKAHAVFTATLKQLNAEIAASPVCWHNFHDATRAVFEEVSLEVIRERQPDFISASGSMYWRTARGVYRLSNHWGLGIRSCDWYLRRRNGTKDEGYSTALAFCAYEHFLRPVHRKSAHYLVNADGTKSPCIAGHYLNKAARAAGQTVVEEVFVDGFYPNYSDCCAAKGAV
jgi:hypothetical protein